MVRWAERFARIREGRGRGLVTTSTRQGWRMKRSGTQKRVARLDFERGRSA